MNASELRSRIYEVLDRVLKTGVPVEIERKGGVLRIVPAEPASKLSRLVQRDGVIQGDPQDLVHVDWSSEWRP